MHVIPVTLKAEMGRITVQGQPEQKVSKTHILSNKLVVHICNPSWVEGIGKRIEV
jgi:hypothetical protein